MILVDSSVLLDVLSDDVRWRPWSKAQLVSAADHDELAINDIVYAELSIGYDTPADLDAVLVEWHVKLQPISSIGLFLAGKAYQRYRRQGGIRTGVLPDFFVGAHAAAQDCPLLTRDAGRVKAYFPDVALIAP